MFIILACFQISHQPMPRNNNKNTVGVFTQSPLQAQNNLLYFLSQTENKTIRSTVKITL